MPSVPFWNEKQDSVFIYNYPLIFMLKKEVPLRRRTILIPGEDVDR